MPKYEYLPPDPEINRMIGETERMICSFAPSSTAATTARRKIKEVVGTPQFRLGMIVSMLYDGLVWGNWPWTNFLASAIAKEVK